MAEKSSAFERTNSMKRFEMHSRADHFIFEYAAEQCDFESNLT